MTHPHTTGKNPIAHSPKTAPGAPMMPAVCRPALIEHTKPPYSVIRSVSARAIVEATTRRKRRSRVNVQRASRTRPRRHERSKQCISSRTDSSYSTWLLIGVSQVIVMTLCPASSPSPPPREDSRQTGFGYSSRDSMLLSTATHRVCSAASSCPPLRPRSRFTSPSSAIGTNWSDQTARRSVDANQNGPRRRLVRRPANKAQASPTPVSSSNTCEYLWFL